MKLSASQKVHYDSGPNMTPLVDVVMVILIFLMLTGTFAGATFYMRANLPAIDGGEVSKEPKPDHVPMDAKIDVHVDQIGNEMFCRVGGSQPIQDPARLTATLKALADNLKAPPSNKKDDEIQVIIFPSKTVSHQNVMQVFAAALQAKVSKVAFGAKGKDTGAAPPRAPAP